MQNVQRVLVVDDDPTVSEVVTGYLERAGFVVDGAADGPGALAAAERHRPDLVVLDLMLPGMDGLQVCRRLRTQGPVPVIMLTARSGEEERILGLEVGADDYVTKPFSPRELVLRVESVLRRAAVAPPPPGPPLRSCALEVDAAARRATKQGQELALTLREFDLLVHFLRHPGEVCSRERLMREVWGWEFGDLSTVTVHVRRLRSKIEDDPARPRLIRTVWGAGYRFGMEAEVVGAGAVGARAVESGTVGTGGREVGPRQAGSVEVGSVGTGPIETEASIEAGSIEAGPRQTGSVETGPIAPGPSEAGPIEAGRREVGPHQAGPRQTGPVEARPAEAGPVEAGPRQVGRRQTGPAEAGSIETEVPIETGPTEAGPVEAGLRQTGRRQAGPVKAGPTEARPSEAGPAEARPVETGSTVIGPHQAGPHHAGPHPRRDVGPRQTEG